MGWLTRKKNNTLKYLPPIPRKKKKKERKKDVVFTSVYTQRQKTYDTKNGRRQGIEAKESHHGQAAHHHPKCLGIQNW